MSTTVKAGAGSLEFDGLAPGQRYVYSLRGETLGDLIEGEAETLVPPPTSIRAHLSDDKTQVIIDGVPAGTDAIHVGVRTGQATWRYSGTSTFPDLPAKATSYQPPSGYPEVSLLALKGGFRVGGWTPPLVTVPATPVPPPVPPPAKSSVRVGLCINSTEGQVDWTRAAGASAQLGRTELTYNSLDAAATYAHAAKMGVLWIDQNPTLDKFLADYHALPAELQATIVGCEDRNESWSGGIGTPVPGKTYGEQFIAKAAAKKAAGLSIPLLMQTRLAKDIKTKFMDELAGVDHKLLAKALEGNGLCSHPYYARATAAQKEPTNLHDYHDVDGNEWGFQRWLKEQQYIRNLTGLTVPMWITEIGFASMTGVPQSVGSKAAVTTHIKALFQHAGEAQAGKILLPDGTPASLKAVVYYDQYAWHLDGAESMGIFVNNSSGQQVPRTEDGIYEAWVSGAKALASGGSV